MGIAEDPRTQASQPFSNKVDMRASTELACVVLAVEQRGSSNSQPLEMDSP